MGAVADIFTHFVGRPPLWTACRNSCRSPGENERIENINGPIGKYLHIRLPLCSPVSTVGFRNILSSKIPQILEKSIPV